MKGQLEKVIERRQHLCTADKVRLMAKTLRNFNGKQCIGKFYDPRNNSMCAYGALGFMSGIPKNELKNDFTKVLANYGIDLGESSLLATLPSDARDEHEYYPQRETSLFQAIYQLNDKGYSFLEIADYLDDWADNLQS